MTVTLEPCPHCGAMLTPALVAEIKDPNGSAFCPRQPRLVKTGMQVLHESLAEVARALVEQVRRG